MARGGQLGARLFVAGMSATALVSFTVAFSHWQSHDPVRFITYLAIAIAASFLRIKLPGVNGTMSVNFLFVFLGVLELSWAETLVFGIAEVLVFVQSRR